MLASAGKEIDSQVAETAAAGATAKKRGSYHQYDGETCVKIARYACEHGQTAAVRHFSKVLEHPITQSTIQSMVKSMRKKLKNEKCDLRSVEELPHQP